MKDLNLVPKSEVQEICKNLGIRDWSTLRNFTVSEAEAHSILKKIGAEALELTVPDFLEGLQIELEHGTLFPDANVTNNHPILTGKIVLAHLKESLLYYKRLIVVELEGDLLKATKAGDTNKMGSLYKKVVSARLILNRAEEQFLKD